MKVYKFGGASVKDAAGIRNLARIVTKEKDDLIIVVSAFGKTTNALEKVLKLWIAGDKSYKEHLNDIYSYHASIAGDLSDASAMPGKREELFFSGLRDYLEKTIPVPFYGITCGFETTPVLNIQNKIPVHGSII